MEIKNNDRPLNRLDVLPAVDFRVENFQGIIDKIKSGFFNDLGINTIWMTPIAQNPETPWGYDEVVKTRFSAYHGYWPIHPTVLNEHFGTEDKLHELLDVAHTNNINVIVDYVANHLHKESPILKEHPDWATSRLPMMAVLMFVCLMNIALQHGLTLSYLLLTWRRERCAKL